MNLNECVWVKFTKAGSELLDELVDMNAEYFTAAERSGEWQLWRLMQVFGPITYNGMPKPYFEKNEIFFEKPE